MFQDHRGVEDLELLPPPKDGFHSVYAFGRVFTERLNSETGGPGAC